MVTDRWLALSRRQKVSRETITANLRGSPSSLSQLRCSPDSMSLPTLRLRPAAEAGSGLPASRRNETCRPKKRACEGSARPNMARLQAVPRSQPGFGQATHGRLRTVRTRVLWGFRPDRLPWASLEFIRPLRTRADDSWPLLHHRNPPWRMGERGSPCAMFHVKPCRESPSRGFLSVTPAREHHWTPDPRVAMCRSHASSPQSRRQGGAPPQDRRTQRRRMDPSWPRETRTHHREPHPARLGGGGGRARHLPTSTPYGSACLRQVRPWISARSLCRPRPRALPPLAAIRPGRKEGARRRLLIVADWDRGYLALTTTWRYGSSPSLAVTTRRSLRSATWTMRRS